MLVKQVAFCCRRTFSTVRTPTITPFTSLQAIIASNANTSKPHTPSTEASDITPEELQRVYHLSYLHLPKTKEELTKVTTSFSAMTSWLSAITHVPVAADAPRMFSPLPLLVKHIPQDCLAAAAEGNLLRLRNDTDVSRDYVEQLMKCSPNKDRNYYVVPAAGNEQE